MTDKKKLTWKERKLAEEHKTIIMEGPTKTNTWWRDSSNEGKEDE